MSKKTVHHMFFERIYELSADRKLDIAIDTIFRHLKQLLNNKNFLCVDNILEAVDFTRLEFVLIISFLIATYNEKGRLLNWDNFLKKVKVVIQEKKIDQSVLSVAE